MTFALKELTRLLSPDALTVGSVVEVSAGLVRIATERGAVSARSIDVLAVGDRVVIRNGMATKSPIANRVFPV